MPTSFVDINVVLPKNRDFPGTMTVLIDGAATGFSCLVKGRGSAGGGNTMFTNKGNTPDGTYRGEIVATKGWNENSYGPNGAIRLHPLSGNAYKAWKTYKRTGLLIHGGSPPKEAYKNLEVNSGGLRPTYGCLRLSDDNVLKLMTLLGDARRVSIPQKTWADSEEYLPGPVHEKAMCKVNQYIDGRLFKPLAYSVPLDGPTTATVSSSSGKDGKFAAYASIIGPSFLDVELDIKVTVVETA